MALEATVACHNLSVHSALRPLHGKDATAAAAVYLAEVFLSFFFLFYS